ncbi:hypothetical protein MKX01_015864, partial [Papaver californicum]
MNTAITLLTSSSLIQNGYCYCSSTSRAKASLDANENRYCVNDNEKKFLKRREALVSGVSLVSSSLLIGSFPVLLAGRVPGLSDPDEQGWRTYRRPNVPVSIADLGGIKIDLRFASSQAGRLFVIVAPVLRFSSSLGDDFNIEMVGTHDKVISAFGPEVTGENVEGKVLNTEVAEHSGRKYYQYELETPHVLMSTTAAGNRLYIFAVTAN